MGYVYTDLGVLFRQRASSDLDKAKSFYEKALRLIPDFCLAESYLVELYIKKNDQNLADTQFEVACQACGKSNLDMELVRMAYEEKGWSLPANSNCRVSKPGSNLITNDIHERGGRTRENETDDLLRKVLTSTIIQGFAVYKLCARIYYIFCNLSDALISIKDMILISYV